MRDLLLSSRCGDAAVLVQCSNALLHLCLTVLRCLYPCPNTPDRLQDLIVDSLTNIRRELKFFEDVAQRYGLSIEVPEAEVSEGVKAYRELFAEMSEGLEAGTVEMLDAMAVLWGTEKVCLPLSCHPLSIKLPPCICSFEPNVLLRGVE